MEIKSVRIPTSSINIGETPVYLVTNDIHKRPLGISLTENALPEEELKKLSSCYKLLTFHLKTVPPIPKGFSNHGYVFSKSFPGKKKVENYGVRISFGEDDEVAHAYVYFIGGFAYLEDVFVREDQRGKGLGNKLLAEICTLVEKVGVPELLLTCRYAKTTVHAWYERNGFKKVGVEYRKDF